MTEGAKVSLYGYDTATWRPVIVDAAGHLQVDVLTSALPSGAASLGAQNVSNDLLSLIYGRLGTRLPAALDGLSLKVKEQGTPSVHLYGYDGANWQTLLVHSAANPNLRVQLYDGASPVTSYAWRTTYTVIADTEALGTLSQMMIYSLAGNLHPVFGASLAGDARGGVETLPVAPSGYNGATYDRLRSYGLGILKVGRAEVGLLDVRMTGVGQVGAAGARKLYWLACNPSAGNSVWEITDDTDGSTAIRLDCFSTTREAKAFVFDPPMEFTNGIYLKTFTSMTSCVFGYL